MAVSTVCIATFLCLALLVSNSEQIYTSTKNAIVSDGFSIRPDTAYFKTVKRSETLFSDSAEWYQQIEFLRNIDEATNLTLGYTLQKKQYKWHGGAYWDMVGDGTVNLCHEDPNTQDGTIAELVRLIIGMPVGCPVSEGVRDMDWFHFTLNNELLKFDQDLSSSYIALQPTLRDQDNPSVDMLRGTIDIITDY